MNKRNDSNQKAMTVTTENLLKLLEEKYKLFHYYKRENCDHSKVLIWNDERTEWILVGSFNFLSFYPRQEDNREETAIITDSKILIHRYKSYKIISP